jgi:hypothetical protein
MEENKSLMFNNEENQEEIRIHQMKILQKRKPKRHLVPMEKLMPKQTNKKTKETHAKTNK